ncbi:MAG TPA: LPS assembly lipoprotein LptE [Stellaceae bacterium]|nr:LPS assembly lipoprotein LptE [Stellaceae bacterium]
MSWSRRGILAALASAPLAGCGFHPLYGGHTAGEYDPRLAAIKVDPIPDREGQLLELALREKLNPRGVTTPTLYTLSVILTLTLTDLGIQRNATSTRSEVNAGANYTLRGAGINIAGSSRTVSAFNLQNDAWAATVAQDDARERAIEDLADAIYMQLSLWSRQQTAAR